MRTKRFRTYHGQVLWTYFGQEFMVAKLFLTNRRIGFYLYVLIGTIMNYFNLFCLILRIYFY